MKKTIVITSMIHSGGTERVVANLANMWSLKDEVEIVVTGKNTDSFYELNKNINIIGLGVDIYKHTPMSVLKWLMCITLGLCKYIKEHKPDVILGIWTSIAVCCIIAGVIKKIPSIACEHISYDYTKLSLKILRRIIYPYATRVVTLTKQDVDKFMKYCKKVTCIENEVTFVTSQYPYYETKTILSIGRMDSQKGFDLLLEMWSKLMLIEPDWKLRIVGCIIGDDEYSKKIIEIIDRYKLKESVEIIPPKKNIKDYYFDASIYIMTSRFEGLPMVLLEAMSAGLPIVSYDCPTGPREVIKSNINGYLVPFNNEKEMIEKLTVLMDNIGLRRKFGINSKEIIEKNYISERISDKWEEVFGDIK